MKKDKHQRKHDRLVLTLEQRLRSSGRYYSIQHNLNYNSRGLCGEYDVYALHHERGITYHHYYEVKCTNTQQNFNHAVDQFARALKAYPSYHWKFIYVTPTHIEQVKIVPRRSGNKRFKYQ